MKHIFTFRSGFTLMWHNISNCAGKPGGRSFFLVTNGKKRMRSRKSLCALTIMTRWLGDIEIECSLVLIDLFLFLFSLALAKTHIDLSFFFFAQHGGWTRKAKRKNWRNFWIWMKWIRQPVGWLNQIDWHVFIHLIKISDLFSLSQHILNTCMSWIFGGAFSSSWFISFTNQIYFPNPS